MLFRSPVTEILSEFVYIPAASRVLDKLSYGEPITGSGKANVPLIPDDTFDAATAVLGGLNLVKKLGTGALKAAQGFGKGFDKEYARAMSKQEPPFLNELGYDSALDKQPVKLLGQQPRVMTALPGTPQGATYATRQEGPFYRVSPTTLDVSKAKTRGIREGDELQGQAPDRKSVV